MSRSITAPLNETNTQTLLYRYRFYFLLIPTVGAGVFLFLIDIQTELSYKPADLYAKWTLNNLLNKEYFSVKTTGCKIPALPKVTPQILKYISNPPDIKCLSVNETNIPLVSSNHSYIWIIEENIIHYNILEKKKLFCCYKSFYRPKSVDDVDGTYVDDRVQYSEDCLYFNSTVKITEEFIKVECEYNNDSLYWDYFSFVHPPKAEEKVNWNNNKKLNVLLIGIDSVSRLNFHRTMPETLKYLKKLEAVELMGYNKVGDNTFPNVIPLLTGINIEELRSNCWPDEESTFDNCPFIWRKFKEAGYATAFAEDASWMGIFNYIKRGFIGKPTDYYWRPYIKEAEKVIGHYKYSNANLCLGSRFVYNVLLKYIYNFTKVLANYLHFGFFWVTSISHDYLNLPALTDKKYKTLLSKLYKEGYLNKTVVLLMSDHGMRFGDIRQTHQGQLEEKLPFVFFLLPDLFRDNFTIANSNLRRNMHYLTTPFDIHMTLRDIVDIKSILNTKIKQRAKEPYANQRGISLFLPIPENRTCQTAGIEEHWCACHQRQKIAATRETVKNGTSYALQVINNLTSSYPQCAELSLKKIIDVTISESVVNLAKNDSEWRYYTIVFSTVPGNAVFEATVRKLETNFILTGTVSRLNRYGLQSQCVDHFHIKLYCYCYKLKNNDNAISENFNFV